MTCRPPGSRGITVQFTTSATGTIEAVVDWTLTSSDLDVGIAYETRIVRIGLLRGYEM